jgi:hypothetical protein
MSLHGAIKVWTLTPEQMANYQTGMDLGKPDRIEHPQPVRIMEHQYDVGPRREGKGKKRGSKV